MIVDASVASLVFASPPDPEFAPVIDWLEKKDGLIVFGGRLTAELERLKVPRERLRGWWQAGKAKLIDGHLLAEAEEMVSTTGLCRSNDAHVIALAQVSGARTLCANDGKLERDFKNLQLVSEPKGSIYKRRSHVKLLRHTSSCGLLKRNRRKRAT